MKGHPSLRNADQHHGQPERHDVPPWRHRIKLRVQPRSDDPVYQVRKSAAKAGPNWAIIMSTWPGPPR